MFELFLRRRPLPSSLIKVLVDVSKLGLSVFNKMIKDDMPRSAGIAFVFVDQVHVRSDSIFMLCPRQSGGFYLRFFSLVDGSLGFDSSSG